jgi:filamentous hemagglutinin family protein
MKSPHLLIISILIISLSTNAEITTDGSLGSRANLPGTDYLIGADLGRQMGGNLFHSFKDFNLNSLESATFSGPNNVSNIISRVTGGNPSNIDGLIRSTIPNADMYFLNPYGIMFGPNARLDVQGSFHASTADYLRLGKGGRFDARNPSDNLLTVAPIEAFGFLTDTPSPITMRDSKLSVPESQSLSLIGGDLQIQGTEAFRDKKTRDPVSDNAAVLASPSGHINLASVAMQNEVKITPIGLEFSHHTGQNGSITTENMVIDVTGERGGNLFIRAGDVKLTNTQIDSQTRGKRNGGLIDIRVDNLEVTQGSELFTSTYDSGNATTIHIHATGDVELSGMNHTKRASTINSNTFSKLSDAGDASEILIEARNLSFLEGAHVNSTTFGGGDGVRLTILASESIIFSGVDSSGWRIGGLTADGVGTVADAGNTGHLYLEAKNITFENGAGMQSGILGKANLGNVTIRASEKFTMTGQHKDKTGSQLHSRVMDKSSGGQGGEFLIEAGELVMEDGARIFASTDGIGNGGNITIRVKGTLTMSNSIAQDSNTRIVSNSKGGERVETVGDGGTIIIQAGNLIMKEGANISSSAQAHKNKFAGKAGEIHITVADQVLLSGFNPQSKDSIVDTGIYAISEGIGDNSSDAGKIILKAGSLTIEEGAVIRTSTNNNAQGGIIEIQVKDTVKIIGNTTPLHQKQSISGIYANSDSVDIQGGHSGNITLQAKNLILTKNGTIATSSAGGGQAGSIIIDVNLLRLDHSASITSSSHLPNTYQFATLSERDNQMVILGDVVDVSDNSNGKIARYVNVGQNFLQVSSIDTVANLTELYELSKHYDIQEGDIVEVKDIGNGQSARFLYDYNDSFDLDHWTKVGVQFDVVLAHIAELPRNDWYDPDKVPYPSGTIVQVNDAGDGTTTQVIYSHISLPVSGQIGIKAIRIKSFEMPDITALNQLSQNTYLQKGDLAVVGGHTRFIFADNQWIPFSGNTLSVADLREINNLIKTQTGNIAKIADKNGQSVDFIYTGQHWISLNPLHRTVQNFSELNQLSAKNGDFVKVKETGTNRQENFFYANNQWIKQIKGGDAGTISMIAQDLSLMDDSEISTEAASAGGGITLKANDLVFLKNSQITTSVQEGIGNGGDLTVNSEFIILENGKIITRANEGQGGNINITTTGIYTFPPESSSTIDASSKLGIDGSVHIESPDVDMDAFLVVLPGGFVETQLIQCTNKEIENPSTFKVDLVRDRAPPFEKFLKLEP